jgi:hypothetical protein
MKTLHPRATDARSRGIKLPISRSKFLAMKRTIE